LLLLYSLGSRNSILFGEFAHLVNNAIFVFVGEQGWHLTNRQDIVYQLKETLLGNLGKMVISSI